MSDAAAANQACLDRFWSAFQAKSEKGLRTCFAADLAWHMPPYFVEVDKRAKQVYGADEMAAKLSSNAPAFYDRATMTIDLMALVAGERDGAIHFAMATKTSSGKDYHNRYIMMVRFADGLIAEVWEYLDTALWLHTMGDEAAQAG